MATLTTTRRDTPRSRALTRVTSADLLPNGEIAVSSSSHDRGARRYSRTDSFPRSVSTALVWIWQTRLSLTPSTSPICASVMPSK
jgi:hypothetical protein